MAIHLDKNVREALKLNPEVHLQPIVGLDGIESAIIDADIISHELCLYDLQPPVIGGMNDDLIFSSRLDNLCSTWAALQGMLETDAPSGNTFVMLAMLDNEEVGSQSITGADSSLVEGVLRRIVADEQRFLALCDASLFISADMAHGAHPNYPEVHDELNRPLLGKGIVLKHRHNKRYATTSRTSALLKQLCFEANLPTQHFSPKNDIPCGTTIGPILSSKLRIECADVGIPQLSMHSIREVCAVNDVLDYVKFFKTLVKGKLSAIDYA